MAADALVFDLDGTLADTLPDLGGAVNWSLAKHGYPVHELFEYKRFIGNGSKVLIEKALKPAVLNASDFKIVFDDYLSYYLKHVAIKTVPYPDMVETLTKLKSRGIRLFVLTNKPQAAAQELIDKLFPGLFDEVVGNSGKIPTKPNPTGMILLMHKYNLRQDTTVYVGDSDVDLELADNAGLIYKVAASYGYRSLGELKSHKPYFILQKPSDLLMMPCLF